jgi:hypothetical protein
MTVFFSLAISCQAFAALSDTDVKIQCAKRAYTETGVNGVGVGSLCAYVKTELEINAVIKCAKRAYSETNADAQGVGLLCAAVKN